MMSSWMAIVDNKLGWKGLQNLSWRQAPSWNSCTITSQSMRDGELYSLSAAVAFNMTLSRGCSGTQGALLLILKPNYNISISSVRITLSRGCSGTQGALLLILKPNYNISISSVRITLSRGCSGTQSALLLILKPNYNISISSVHITLSRGCSGTQGTTQLK